MLKLVTNRFLVEFKIQKLLEANLRDTREVVEKAESSLTKNIEKVEISLK